VCCQPSQRTREEHILNRPRKIGTSAESALVRFLRSRGIQAERRPLAGARDQGDVWAADGRVVLEVKVRAGGYPTPKDWARWHTELDREVTNAALAGAPVDVGVLVVKRPGSGLFDGVGDWWAQLTVEDWAWLATTADRDDVIPALLQPGQAVQVTVAQLAAAIAGLTHPPAQDLL